MLHNKRGAALLQVLLVTVVLAGMATMLLRANLSRTTTSRQTRRAVSSQMLISACQAEINALWSLKDADQFAADLKQCLMFCNRNTGSKRWCVKPDGELDLATRSYKCKPVTAEGVMYQVEATFTGSAPNANTGQCDIKYDISTVTPETVDYPSAGPTAADSGDDNNGNGNGGNNHFDPYEEYYLEIDQARINASDANASAALADLNKDN